jgi:hypothetical protein
MASFSRIAISWDRIFAMESSVGKMVNAKVDIVKTIFAQHKLLNRQLNLFRLHNQHLSQPQSHPLLNSLLKLLLNNPPKLLLNNPPKLLLNNQLKPRHKHRLLQHRVLLKHLFQLKLQLYQLLNLNLH